MATEEIRLCCNLAKKIKAAEGVDPQPMVDNQDFTQAIGE
jgi:hypothetical protein